MADDLETRAREAAHNVVARLHGRGAAIMGPHEIVSAALVAFARDFAERAIRESFYTTRDEKAPGVWLFCKHRDERGDELLQDDRLWPRHADAKQALEKFITAAIDAAAKGST